LAPYDYLVKPFAFAELLARARTLLRRGKAKEPELLRVADLTLDLLRRRVSRAAAASISPPRIRPARTADAAAGRSAAALADRLPGLDMNFDSDTTSSGWRCVACAPRWTTNSSPS